jgi:hypothetical protein
MNSNNRTENHLRKTFVIRGILGIIIGLAIGYTMLTILAIGFGLTSMVNPRAPFASNTSLALIVQYFSTAVLGLIFGLASVIWEIDRWSLVKRTAIYFLATASSMIAVTLLSGWIPLEWGYLLAFLGIFVLIFGIIWLVIWFIARRVSRRIDPKV